MRSHNAPVHRRGFTLAETVIAVAVVATLLTTFIAAFLFATDSMRKATRAEEADRLAYALEEELVTLRGSGEVTEYRTGFGKAFEWIRDAWREGEAVLVFHYRGELGNVRADGSLAPYLESGGVAGQDFIIQPIARRAGEVDGLAAEFQAVEGGVFVAMMTQLVFEDGGLVPGTAGSILDPRSKQAAAEADVYPEAVIAFAAEFHVLPSSTIEYVRDLLDLSDLGRPIFTRNLAVRR